ncbi:hypothetical protein M0811_05456 [Anaeramoeba ignava]|uniref:Uncharacterized protein n=1 Tax=Anaeramoeba ignava TaxID=1746090 RepID=A0A9Q0LQ83_ANAIG|nr:hypothetical protein M0811_05456 [Anaeramoeba ignava]
MEYKKDNEEYDRSFKVILIGNRAAGKTNIISRFQKNKFNPNSQITIDIDFDTSGEERYLSVSRTHYRDAVGAFIVYDITNEESFNKLKFWFEEFQKNAKENAIPMIIGNKCDLEKERKISKEMGQKFAEENKALFMETSAKDGTNIQKAFEILTKEIFNTFENETDKPIDSIILSKRIIIDPKKPRPCC